MWSAGSAPPPRGCAFRETREVCTGIKGFQSGIRPQVQRMVGMSRLGKRAGVVPDSALPSGNPKEQKCKEAKHNNQHRIPLYSNDR